jgi:BirA family biotin operon repressor/biotin-[acetyl-CoA-carboxylase] ligase
VQLSTLSLLIAEIMQHALKDFGIAAPIVIKPPNDLMVAHQKLGGILIDMLHHQKNACTAVIGIGLNVNLEKNEAIDQPWVSLSQLTQTTHDRNILAAYILNALCSTLPHTE